MSTRIQIINDLYTGGDEDTRLNRSRQGQLEFITTMEMIHRHAPAGAKVLEIGGRSVTITRFKGLGEMDAKDLYATTMDPEKRELLRVRLDDDNAVQADKMFTILMGDLVEPRRRFIEDNALNVRNLDV